jgi:hypothetical protein
MVMCSLNSNSSFSWENRNNYLQFGSVAEAREYIYHRKLEGYHHWGGEQAVFYIVNRFKSPVPNYNWKDSSRLGVSTWEADSSDDDEEEEEEETGTTMEEEVPTATQDLSLNHIM